MRPSIATQLTAERLGSLPIDIIPTDSSESYTAGLGDSLISLGYTPKQHPQLDDGTSDGRSLDFRLTENSEEQLEILGNYLNSNLASLNISNINLNPLGLHVEFNTEV